MARCQYPRVALVGYEAWPKGKVFVRVPNESGRYILTDRCVVEVGCSLCKATVGEPCHNPKTGEYWVGTHSDRRSDGADYRRRNRLSQARPKPVYRAADILSKEKP